MKISVAVLFGGNSTEHEISVISAVQAMSNMDTLKYDIIPVYMDKNNEMYYSEDLKDIKSYKNISELKKKSKLVSIVRRNNNFVLLNMKFPYNVIKQIDIAFPIMHGYNTEDGSVAGYLEVLGIPYCQSDIFADVIAQDKIFQKAILKENNVPVVDYVYFYESDYELNPGSVIKMVESLGYPVIIKPSRQGSSVGISIAKNKKELASAIEDAISYDEKILVEKVVENMTELNISVLGDNKNYEVSLIEQVYGADEILSYKDKYLSGNSKGGSKGMASTGRKIPADIPKNIEQEIIKYSTVACKSLNTCGVVRIDYLLDKKDGKVYLNELNITPGSLAFYLWTPKGKEYKELLTNIIDCGIRKYQVKSKKLSSFETNVLENFNGTKGVKK